MEGCHDEAMDRNDPNTPLFIVDGRVSSGGSLREERYGPMNEENLISAGRAVFLALVFAMVLRVVS